MSWRHRVPSFSTLLVLSALLRLGLVLYSEWHDARSLVKYTDVDYRVFTDAARFLLDPSTTAKGPSTTTTLVGLHVGDPYARETYRYTPLLAVLLVPNVLVHPSFGKYLFAACDLLNGVLIHRLLVSLILPPNDPLDRDSLAAFLAGTHLFNPLVFSVSTRGSSESILCTLVLLTLYLALRRRWDAAAVLLGISTHWKIYPFIYGASCVAAITSGTSQGSLSLRRLVSPASIRFAVLSASTFLALGAFCYAIWGHPFLHEAYLYHTHRLDHRHNFSPYFYLTYLTYPAKDLTGSTILPLWRRLVRSPLTSLVPQLTLSITTGLVFGRRQMDLPFTWFVQTYAFVLFNRVCTSQYFLWYTLFLPLFVPRFRFSWLSVIVWAAVQAIWLAEAYKLEFLGDTVYFTLWSRSILYLAGHAWVLGNIIQAYSTSAIPCR